MLHTLKNEYLNVKISINGGELQSITTKNNNELLWQGDATFWGNRATNLFPIVGRLTDGKYTYDNNEYSMGVHGFVRHSTLTPEKTGENSIKFTLTENETTLSQYPFKFSYNVEYTLDKNKITCTYRVKNTDDKTIIFGVGGHPGFNIPLSGESNFEDWQLIFDNGENMKEVLLSDTCYILSKTRPYKDNKILPLKHSLFDNDAIVLQETGGSVTLKSAKSTTQIKMEYSDFNYLGLWHKPKTEAKFVCIEPWTSLPAKNLIVDDLKTKQDMIHLEPNKEFAVSFNLIITE